MTFTLPYPPSQNRYLRHAKGRTYLSAEARAYRAAVARVAPVLPLDGPVSVRIAVYRPRKAGDLDNTFKVLLDALNGLAWHDDSQIEELHGYRYDDKERPRVEVDVRRLSAPVTTPSAKKRRAVRPALVGKKVPGIDHCLSKDCVAPLDGGHLYCATHGYTPPRSTPVDAPALAAETFAPGACPYPTCSGDCEHGR